jgi:hypothetical protein
MLVLCPKPVIEVWIDEAQKAAKYFPGLGGRCALVRYHGKPEDREGALRFIGRDRNIEYSLVVASHKAIQNTDGNPLVVRSNAIEKWWNIIAVDEVRARPGLAAYNSVVDSSCTAL